MINCETCGEDSIISKLKQIDTVKEAYGTFGTFDIISKLESDSEDKIRNDLTKKIRKMQKIRATLTLIAHDHEDSFAKKLAEEEKEILESHMAQAYVLINCKKAAEQEVLRNLSEIPEVTERNIVIGSYEILCRIVAPTYNDITDVVTKKIRKFKNIKSTSTLNVIEEQPEEKVLEEKPQGDLLEGEDARTSSFFILF